MATSSPSSSSAAVAAAGDQLSSTSNVCVFCYDSLLDGAQAVGVAVPCGHCYHQACWTAYEASKRRGDRHHPPAMKCPTCQGRVLTLGKLFLDFDCITSKDNAGNGGEEEDLLSLSSDDGDENEEKEKVADTADPQSNVAVVEVQQPEIIVLDDDDDDDDDGVHQRQTKDAQKIRKYKKMAHKWKAKSGEATEAMKTLTRDKADLKETVEELSLAYADSKRSVQRWTKKNEDVTVVATTLRQEVEKQRERANRLETSLARCDEELGRAKAELKKSRVDTEKARTNYVVEAAQLLKEHPVLAAKVKDLEYKNRVLKAQVQQLHSSETGSSHPKKHKSMTKADQRKLLRHVSNLREREDVGQQRGNSTTQSKHLLPPKRPAKKVPAISRCTGMEVLETQPVLRTGLLKMGKKRPPAAAADRERFARTSAPQKKKSKSSLFR